MKGGHAAVTNKTKQNLAEAVDNLEKILTRTANTTN